MSKCKRVALLLSHFITFFACVLLMIWLVGCGEEREDILHPRVPTLYLTEHDVHTEDFVYFITASEPLPYPLSLTVTITATILEGDNFVEALLKLNVTLNRGSHAWYGFYAGKFLPGEPSSGNVLFDWTDGKLQCVGIRGSFPAGSFRSVERKDVTEITVNISHPSGDDDNCLGSYEYNIGASEITMIKTELELV